MSGSLKISSWCSTRSNFVMIIPLLPLRWILILSLAKGQVQIHLKSLLSLQLMSTLLKVSVFPLRWTAFVATLLTSLTVQVS